MQNISQEHNYIEILKNSLNKKKDILNKILLKNSEQRDIAAADKFDYEAFDVIYHEKGKLIAELNLMDSGFQSIYDRVKDVLVSEKEKYKEDILELQNLVKQVTSLSMEIEASEKRNCDLMEKTTNRMKTEVKTARATNKAAVDYYQNMNKLNFIEPQFMDKKK
ncbi:MAG: flagellar protein FliT [Lachnospiraceae bacterium]|nr:flagellar protein FliT [Lachnospiraceae bacterium]